MAVSHPASFDHPSLSHAGCHAILAFWASDVLALEDAPWLRRLGNGANIRLSEALEALKASDAATPKTNLRLTSWRPSAHGALGRTRSTFELKPNSEWPRA